MENNPIVNAIRPTVIGRKNWLFSVCEASTKANAICLNVAETAKTQDYMPWSKNTNHLFRIASYLKKPQIAGYSSCVLRRCAYFYNLSLQYIKKIFKNYIKIAVLWVIFKGIK